MRRPTVGGGGNLSQLWRRGGPTASAEPRSHLDMPAHVEVVAADSGEARRPSGNDCRAWTAILAVLGRHRRISCQLVR